jgi:hypothetical protein
MGAPLLDVVISCLAGLQNRERPVAAMQLVTSNHPLEPASAQHEPERSATNPNYTFVEGRPFH